MKASNSARLRKIEEALLPSPAPSGPVCVCSRPGKSVTAEIRRAEVEGRRIVVVRVVRTPKSIPTPDAAPSPADDVDQLRAELLRLEKRHAALAAGGSDE